MSRKLLKSLQVQKKQTEQVKLTIYGSLGILLGGQKIVQVADRQGYVYVRLRDNQNEVIQAFNNKVAASYDLPIIVVREGGRYIVQQFNSQRYLNNAQNSAPFLPNHGTQHSFPRGGGADITWVYPQQFMPALVYPSPTTGTNVYIDRYPLYTPDNRWIYAGGTGTQNILQYLPTTGSSSLMVLVYMDAYTGNPGILVGSGTYFPAAVSGSIYQYIPSPSVNQIPLAGVLLNTGTKTIQWSNIYDVRQWVHATPSGTSSTGGGIDTIGFVGQNKGVYLATGTTLNVNGTRVTMSVSGTTFNLTNSPDPYDNIGFYGMSGTTGIGTGTTLVVRDYLGLSATGTFLYLNPSIGTGTFQLASGDRGVTNGDTHDHIGGDGGTIAHTSLSSIGTNTHAQIDTQLSNHNDGWTAVSGSWTYASATTITVPTGAASIYSVGDKIKMTNSGTKYNYVVVVADTVLTVLGDGVANAAITVPFYSKASSPLNFPNKFNYTPVFSAVTGTPPAIGNGTLTGAFSLNGKTITYDFILTFGSTSTYGVGNSWWTVTIPIASFRNSQVGIGNAVDDGVVWVNAPVLHGSVVSGDIALLYGPTSAFLIQGVPFTYGTADSISCSGSYLIA